MTRRFRSGGLLAAVLLGLVLPAAAGAATPRILVDRGAAATRALPQLSRHAAPAPADAVPAAAPESPARDLRPFPHDLYATGAIPAPLRPVRELLREGVLAAAENPGPDTLRLAVFRVDFLQDSEGDATTSDGTFDLRTDVTGVPVDPPPHDRGYFEKHAEALARFYAAQSYGSLVIETTVLPEDPEGAYHLQDTADYGPWQVAQADEVILNAEEFVTDAINAVDAQGAVDFSAFDAFVVVHAGPDFQGDINRDSPGDIPSFTLTLGESLSVSTGKVGRVLVLPETVSQDGRLAALNGVFAHEFGHVLGLPDLYNIFNGIPQVGYWSLMDSGDNIEAIIVDPDIPDSTTESGFGEYYVSGAFPTSFDPWCKMQIFPKGIAPLVVEESLAENLEAVEVNPDLPYVSIDGAEYFLIENRALDLDGNGFPFVQQDSTTGVFMGPVDDPDNPGAGGRLEYDAVLPGGGVFIWHIDDKIVIPAMNDRGQVNLATGFRGIAVVEADGIWDQGRFNLGRPEDAFYLGNNTLFAPGTIPGSEANDGAWSGIRVEVTSAPARFMGVSIERPLAHKGWPFYLPQNPSVSFSGEDLAVADLDGDGAGNPVFHVDGLEAGRPQGLHGVGYVFHDDEADADRFGLFGRTPNPLLGGLSATSGFTTEAGASPRPAVAAVESVVGRVHLWSPDGEELMASQVAMPALTPPVLIDRPAGADWVLFGGEGGIYAQTADGQIALAKEHNLVTGRRPTSNLAVATDDPWADDPNIVAAAALAFEGGRLIMAPVAETTDRAVFSWVLPFEPDHLMIAHVIPEELSAPRVVAVSDDSVEVVSFWGVPEAAWALPEGAGPILPPAAADIDGDGIAEIVLLGENGLVMAYNGDGSPALGWPRDIPAPGRDLKVLDVDGDAILDVMALDGAGRMHAWTGRGEALDEHPRALGPYAVNAGAVADLDGDGRLTWVGPAEGGVLLAMRLPGALARDGDWLGAGGSGASYVGLGPLPVADLTQPDLGPERLIVYPNPVRAEGAEIRFLLDSGESATLELLDLTGQELTGARLDRRGGFRAGENAVHWDTGGVAPGLYFCRLVREKEGRRTVDLARVVVMR